MILLDTHAWAWYASNYAKLSRLAQARIDQTSDQRISEWDRVKTIW